MVIESRGEAVCHLRSDSLLRSHRSFAVHVSKRCDLHLLPIPHGFLTARRHIDYCVKLAELMRHHNVIPVLVFDGGTLGAKAGTTSKRKALREENAQKAAALQVKIDALELRLAKALPGLGPSKAALQEELNAARKAFDKACQAAVVVTAEHGAMLIARLRALNIEFVVAPYEADAQLAFLARNGSIDAVLTEDSDLVAFGCPVVLYKFDRNSCEMSELRTDRLHEVGPPFCLTGFTHAMFVQMCVFTGVDYLESPKGLGIGKARKLVAQHESPDRALSALRRLKVEVADGYDTAFANALLTFGHQRVFDEKAGRLVTLNPLPAELEARGDELDDIIGADLPADVAVGIARGLLHPKTRLPYALPRASLPPQPQPQNQQARRAHAQPAQRAGANKPKPRAGADAGDAGAAARLPRPSPLRRAFAAAPVRLSAAVGRLKPPLSSTPLAPTPLTELLRTQAQHSRSTCAVPAAMPAQLAAAPPQPVRNPFYRPPSAAADSLPSFRTAARPAGGMAARTPLGEANSPDEVAVQLDARFAAHSPGASLVGAPPAASPAHSPLGSPRTHSSERAAAAAAACPGETQLDSGCNEGGSAEAAEAANCERATEPPSCELAPLDCLAGERGSREEQRQQGAVVCGHCAYPNTKSVHVCVACDMLLGPARPHFATPAVQKSGGILAALASAAGAPRTAGKRPLEQGSAAAAPARTAKVAKGDSSKRAAKKSKQSIASYFVRPNPQTQARA